MYNKRSKKYKKFIILTMHRSGSNLLGSLLNDHTSIASIGEVYSADIIWGNPEKKEIDGNILLKMYRDVFPKLFLRSIVFHSYPTLVSAVGFRIFYNHLHNFSSVYQTLRADKDIAVIHLVRKNILKNYVSFRIARKTDSWSSRYINPHPKAKVTLGRKECEEYFLYMNKERKYFHQAFSHHPIITVYYEDLIKNQEKTLSNIQDLLGVNKRKLSSSLIKQNTRNLDQVIENYHELKKQFADTPWSKFFK